MNEEPMARPDADPGSEGRASKAREGAARHERTEGQDPLSLELAFNTNPCTICQPIGAVYASIGFEHCLPLVHGSHGCTAYLRMQMVRTFREEVLCVSSSLNEESAVYGGQDRLMEGLQNAVSIYRPKMMTAFSTCLSETIGDDLQGIVRGLRSGPASAIPLIAVPTPSYKMDHIHGFDAAIAGILEYFYKAQPSSENNGTLKDQLTLIPGFCNPADVRELKRLARMFAKVITISDSDDVLIAPEKSPDNKYFSRGGTTIEDVFQGFNSSHILCCQRFALKKVSKSLKRELKLETERFILPMGIRLTDRFVHAMSQITGNPIPAELLRERREVVELVKSAKQKVFGLKAAIFESPDITLGAASLCTEMGMKPVITATNRKESRFPAELKDVLKGCDPVILEGVNHYDFQKAIEAYNAENDKKIDIIIGNTRAKYMEHELGIPLVRVGFPYSDRIGLHRNPVTGYQGAMNLAERIGNTLIAKNDVNLEAVI